MNAVSLFAGIGGFDLALERSGINVVASVEIDKKCQEVLKKQFPNSKIFGDVKEVTGEQLINAGFKPEQGIITGGFPCQDLSVAGKRAGITGARSGLFWEIIRLLKETKAQNFILENVPGLLSSGGGKIWELSLERWMNSGIVSHGECLMLNTSEFHKEGEESSLSEVLETTGDHLAKYSLSAKAAQGILRRANRREKKLPDQLQMALEHLANQDLQVTAKE